MSVSSGHRVAIIMNPERRKDLRSIQFDGLGRFAEPCRAQCDDRTAAIDESLLRRARRSIGTRTDRRMGW